MLAVISLAFGQHADTSDTWDESFNEQPTAPTRDPLAQDKAAWENWPSDALFVPWSTSVTVNTTTFSSVSSRPSSFTPAQAFLATQGTTAPPFGYALPWQATFLGPFTKLKDNAAVRLGLFGVSGDVTDTEFQIVADVIAVLSWVAPDLQISAANQLDEVNFAVLIANEPNGPSRSVWPQYKPSKATAETTMNKFGPPFGPGDPTLLMVRVSNQAGDEQTLPCGGSSGNPCTNRHTLQHEMAHALGLQHFPYAGSVMSPPADQKSYYTQVDLAAIAAVQDPRVSESTPSTEAVCSALGISSCVSTLSEAEFEAAPPKSDGWAKIEAWICLRTGGRNTPDYACDIGNAASLTSGI